MNKRIAVFCSGNGTNLQALITAMKRKKLRAELSVVVCDNPKAYAIQRAHKARIPTVIINPKHYKHKQAFEKIIVLALRKAGVRYIVLAGYMRLLGPTILAAYKNRIINIHPALLPAFKGTHGIHDAFWYGAKVTGVTIHFVDEQVDHGPIIMQEALAIKPNETLTQLKKRIHALEHRIYYKAVDVLVSGRLKRAGRRVTIVKSER